MSSLEMYIFFINNFNTSLQFYNQSCLFYPRPQLLVIFLMIFCVNKQQVLINKDRTSTARLKHVTSRSFVCYIIGFYLSKVSNVL